MQVAYPYHIDGRGRTAVTGEEQHVRDMIEQILFTVPGERVNRPAFGSGLLQLVFAPNSQALATALQASVQGSLQQWLGDVIEVGDVAISPEDSTLRVTVSYRLRSTGESRSATFSRPLP
jgi:Bacteriophage baseplate protein W